MVGTSVGGRQPKAIIAINRETGEIRSGQVETGNEYDYYILKFGDKKRSTAELEKTYYDMAKETGINMMESKLIEVEGAHHFLTRRFDRDAKGKLHTQTLAAMYPEADTYEKLLMACRKLHLPEVDCQDVYRRLVFNILTNNTDDHNKNFSFIMDHTGKWRLSPAYDLTYIFNISNAHLEQMYKGNYHLLANIDGHNRKLVIRKDTPLSESITQKGLANIDEQFIKDIIERHLR